MESRLNTSQFEKVVYINLKKRSDRDLSIRSELEQLGIPQEKIIRFDAVEDSLGYIGCGKSHLAVLDMAIENDWDNVFILEDDMGFDSSEENLQRANQFLNMLKNNDWDVAMLSGNYFRIHPLKCYWGFVKVTSAYCACAYIVNKKYYATLRQTFLESVESMERTRKQQDAIDVHWLPLMERDKWFGMFPCLGKQQKGHSDIQHGFIDVQSLFEKKLGTIYKGTYCPAGDSGCIASCYHSV